MMTTALLAIAAVLLDWLLGEPRRLHPLIGFGRLANRVEHGLYGGTPRARRLRGAFSVVLLLLPFTAAATTLAALPYVGVVFSLLMLYFAIGHKSLHDHARSVAIALLNNDDDKARHMVGRMVSRDSATLDITGAATESVLENGNDGVFGALFWFAIAGAPGAVLYRLANTLDAMWGYRNDRYRDFGWAAACFDDALNYLPARLTALTYALVAVDVLSLKTLAHPCAVLRKTRQALDCWRTQAPAWDSPNAGPVMAAGAGALGICIGGPACYLGEWHKRPILGTGAEPVGHDIERALRLVRHGVWLWLGLFVVAGGLAHA